MRERNRERNQGGGGGCLSAVVIKACVLKGGQSIRLAASTSHQTSAKNDSPGPGRLLVLLREAASNRWLRSGVGHNHSRGHGRPESQRANGQEEGCAPAERGVFTETASHNRLCR